jgi:Protein of unknown function (DUF2490)
MLENGGSNVILRRFLPIVLTVSGFFAVGNAQTATPTFGTDFQLWNETQIIIPLDKKKDWNFAIWVVDRYGNNVRQVTDARIGGLLTKKINKYVTLGGGYLYRYSNPTFVRRRYESRYIGQAIFTLPLGNKFTLVNREQVQYEDRYLRPNAVVIRTKVTLKREIELAHKKFEPFVSFEPFYDSRLKTIARYREQIGFSHKFSKQFSADFFYVRQDETGNHTRPGTLNGLGTSFKIYVR